MPKMTLSVARSTVLVKLVLSDSSLRERLEDAGYVVDQKNLDVLCEEASFIIAVDLLKKAGLVKKGTPRG